MSNIKRFHPNSNQYLRLKIVESALNAFTDRTFHIEDVYFDLDQGLEWTTIIADQGLLSYQFLLSKEQDGLCDDAVTPELFFERLNALIQRTNKTNTP